MTAQSKLADTQTAILKAATDRADGNIEPLPPTLRGGARTKVIEGLLPKGLVAGANGHHLLTDAGYAAVGKQRPIQKGVQKMDTPDALTKREATHALQKLEATSRTIRPGTKLAAIIDAMRHPGGATIAQMMAGTGWQAHTVRGAISGMVRKRLGFEVVTEKGRTGNGPIASPDCKPPQGSARTAGPFLRPNLTVAVLLIVGLEIAGNLRQYWPGNGWPFSVSWG